MLDVVFNKVEGETDNKFIFMNKVYDYLLTKDLVMHLDNESFEKGYGFNPNCSYDGLLSMLIVNPLNKKCIVFSLGDRRESIYDNKDLFKKYDVVQIIGGLSFNYESEEQHHTPFNLIFDESWKEKYLNDFKPSTHRKQKAIFIGDLYDGRKEITDVLKKHPGFVIYDQKYTFKDYLKTISEYAISLSLNGYGEICYRDYESMAIGIPVLRSLLRGSYYKPLIPNFHYIVGSESATNGFLKYNSSYEGIADQFIDMFERIYFDELYLNMISLNGRLYYENNIRIENAFENFKRIINLDLLK
ncbi:MAG: hypothetical protein KDH96_00390 [Candidatus Riesia sp.]|nr:hypothetical protein [Candidatus Riesia sp.]